MAGELTPLAARASGHVQLAALRLRRDALERFARHYENREAAQRLREVNQRIREIEMGAAK